MSDIRAKLVAIVESFGYVVQSADRGDTYVMGKKGMFSLVLDASSKARIEVRMYGTVPQNIPSPHNYGDSKFAFPKCTASIERSQAAITKDIARKVIEPAQAIIQNWNNHVAMWQESNNKEQNIISEFARLAADIPQVKIREPGLNRSDTSAYVDGIGALSFSSSGVKFDRNYNSYTPDKMARILKIMLE